MWAKLPKTLCASAHDVRRMSASSDSLIESRTLGLNLNLAEDGMKVPEAMISSDLSCSKKALTWVVPKLSTWDFKNLASWGRCVCKFFEATVMNAIDDAVVGGNLVLRWCPLHWSCQRSWCQLACSGERRILRVCFVPDGAFDVILGNRKYLSKILKGWR